MTIVNQYVLILVLTTNHDRIYDNSLNFRL